MNNEISKRIPHIDSQKEGLIVIRMAFSFSFRLYRRFTPSEDIFHSRIIPGRDRNGRPDFVPGRPCER